MDSDVKKTSEEPRGLVGKFCGLVKRNHGNVFCGAVIGSIFGMSGFIFGYEQRASRAREIDSDLLHKVGEAYTASALWGDFSPEAKGQIYLKGEAFSEAGDLIDSLRTNRFHGRALKIMIYGDEYTNKVDDAQGVGELL